MSGDSELETAAQVVASGIDADDVDSQAVARGSALRLVLDSPL